MIVSCCFDLRGLEHLVLYCRAKVENLLFSNSNFLLRVYLEQAFTSIINYLHQQFSNASSVALKGSQCFSKD